MSIKGFDQLQKHFPDLQTSGGRARMVLLQVFWIALTLAFFYWVDAVFAEWMPDGEIVFLTLGFLLLAQFFRRKTAYQARYGALAYRHAFVRFAMPGLGILFAAIIHLAYMPGVAL